MYKRKSLSRGSRRAQKKRFRRGTKTSIKRLSKRITTLARAVTPEKKRYETSNANTTEFLGQININATNNFYQDVTPIPTTGASFTGRTGASINLTGALFRFQFATQSGQKQPIRLVLEWFHVKGTPQSALTFVSNLFNPNQFVYTAGGVIANVIDFNSDMDPDYMGQSRLIRRKYVTIPQNNFSAGVQIKSVHVPIKFKKGHHVRFNGDSSTVADGQIILSIRADSGNTGGTNSTLVGVPIQTNSTGTTFGFDYRYYYHDA